MPADRGTIEGHYDQGDLVRAIGEALAAGGKSLDAVSPDDLAPLDEFHIRGAAATLELAERAGIAANQLVLDVGCGLGGPARRLAVACGCRVVGIDLTESYCRAATEITRRMGLDDRVAFRHGDALAMPFDDGSFDIVWTQHASMNIADKDGLAREMRRVLRPGGVLALNDVAAGPDGPPHFPVPWASDPKMSFLDTADGMRERLVAAGFRERLWRDTTEEAIAWFRSIRPPKDPAARPLITPGLALGPDFATMGRTLFRNLEEGRVVVVQGVFDRDGAGG